MAIMASKNHQKYNYNNNDGDDDYNKLSNDELEVAAVLLELPYLITKSLSDYRFPYDWGSKKLRSALTSIPTPPPPPPPRKREAASPNTPLSFSLSDSDSKPKKKPRFFLRKEELEHTVKERLHTQHQLKESIEKVQVYLKSLIAENSELKARKQKYIQLEMNTLMREKKLERAGGEVTTSTVEDADEDEVPCSWSACASHHLFMQPQPQPQPEAADDEMNDSNDDERGPMISIDLNMSPEEVEKAERRRRRRCEEARKHRLDVHN